MDNLISVVRKLAFDEGFDDVGYINIESLEFNNKKLDEWLDKGFNASMHYMNRNVDIRKDPSKIIDGAKSVFIFLQNYYTNESLSDNTYKISKYAYGKDYHKVLRKKLKRISKQIEENHKQLTTRIFVDTAPIMEKALAQKANLGWIGKNSLLINKKLGSYFFICGIATNVELTETTSAKEPKNYCGSCTNCIDACPTKAITSPYVVDSNKCISFLTIENKEEIPKQFKGTYSNWIFGCDICQQVCPWNKKVKHHKEPDFKLSDNIKNLTAHDWENIDEESFNTIFNGSAIKRAKFEGLKRNIDYLR